LMLTISVVSHGQGRLVPALLTTLETHKPTCGFEVLLTLNVSEPDPTENLKLTYPVRLIKNSVPYGFGKNHNRAFSVSKGRYFCVLNPDIVFIEEVLSHLIGRMESVGAGIIAPGIVDASGKVQDNFRKLPTPQRLIAKCLGASRNDDLVEVNKIGLAYPDFISGMFLLLKSSLFRQLGGFDERYFLYYEDVDLSLRCRLAGYPVVVDTRIKVIHEAQMSSHRSLRYLRWHTTSAVKFFTSRLFWRALKGRDCVKAEREGL